MHRTDFDTDEIPQRGVSRRSFLRTSVGAAAGLAGWTPAFRLFAQGSPLPNFPQGIALYQQAYSNWSGEVVVEQVWTCAPTSPQDVVRLANWSKSQGYHLRARGMMHTWAPLTLANGGVDPPGVLLADTTQYLTAVSINATTSPATVTAQTGVTLDTLVQSLENAGLGFCAMPAIGTITLGGVLAIDGHGSALPAAGETLPRGQTFGSISNRILSLTAVVWDSTQNQYCLRQFQRTDPECGALMTHLGRAFITEVTLQVGANQRVRCQSFTDIGVAELFAPAGSPGRTFAAYMQTAGRAEAIWFPFTSTPWLKIWSLAPSQPLGSIKVNSPYNYVFTDVIPKAVAVLAEDIVAGQPQLAPALGAAQYTVSDVGLTATLTRDIWGWSKNVLLYILPSTLRLGENGHAILTQRSQIQQVVNDFTNFFSAQLAAYQALGRYPINGAVEIRATGMDYDSDCGVPGASTALLSALRPRPDQPQWDVVLWLNCLSIPGTPYLNEFNRELEQWMFQHYSGSYAAVRPEWSKGWGYGSTVGWSDPAMLGSTIPNAYRAGQPSAANWDAAVAMLDQLDPYRIYSSPLLENLLP